MRWLAVVVVLGCASLPEARSGVRIEPPPPRALALTCAPPCSLADELGLVALDELTRTYEALPDGERERYAEQQARTLETGAALARAAFAYKCQQIAQWDSALRRSGYGGVTPGRLRPLLGAPVEDRTLGPARSWSWTSCRPAGCVGAAVTFAAWGEADWAYTGCQWCDSAGCATIQTQVG